MSQSEHGMRMLRRLELALRETEDAYGVQRALMALTDLLRNPMNLRPSLEFGIPKALIGLLGHDEPSIRQKTVELLGAFNGGGSVAREIQGQEMKPLKKELLEQATNMALALGHRNRPQLAITAAIEALKFGSEVYGHGSAELVPSILLLAEKSIEVGKLNKAETCLTQASYIVGKSADTPSETKAGLYRVLGQLYTARGNGPLALRFLADDVYFSSMAHGPEDIKTAGGYFLMAGVFLSSGHAHDASKAEVLHDTIEQIWRTYLSEMLKTRDGTTFLTEAEAVEARHHLMQIVAERSNAADKVKLAQGRSTLAMLLAALGQLEDATSLLDSCRADVEAAGGSGNVLADIEGTLKIVKLMQTEAAEAAAADAAQ